MRAYRTRTRIIAATATLSLALGGTLFAAPTAQAATTVASVVHENSELWYKGAAGQTNNLTVSTEFEERGPWEYYYVITFRDQGDITIDPSVATTDECAYPSETDHTVVQCATEVPLGSDDSDNYDVDLGDGDDTATVNADSSAYSSIHGGPGDDVLQGSAADVLYGDDGNDRLDGGGGVWSVGPYGGPGDDTITDCATDCWGGAGNDSLTGGTDPTDNHLYGDDGNDVIHGLSDADFIYGGLGHDTLYGDEGNDTIYGDSGNDTLYGGQGTDTLSGGPGIDKVYQD
ncbi:calcium-binding protein [Streptomyces sp. AK02-01A]|uniref:calcium-binding protein n=1 Tax=Streptomyces sp. AK02-01A TaxID=3028648 RepID=UPI0029B790AE|nr:calcium-binding protein [Streptomyces sp. AK02-01A]MDX3851977.1 calcium-binding protein [Streptomyces sp. AK02-01A]